MSKRAIFIWLAAYAVLMTILVVGLLQVRKRTLTNLSTPEARENWQQWRDQVSKQAEESPVHRRIPKSTEPPGLILMRDHFPAILAAAIFFATVLFTLLAGLARGALRGALNSKTR
jgi:hypothetical protein